MNDARHPRRWLALTTLCLAVLVAQVDTAVVNLATRSIGAHFDAGMTALQWVLDSYNLVYAVLLLTGGLLADLYGRRRIFMIGAAIFTAASLLCALAWTMPVLIAARAIAGLGAAFLLPASLAIIRVVWPDPSERGRVLGIWAGCNGLAMAIGPTLGGVLVQAFGWRSIFVAVVPLSLAALVLALPSIPESADPQNRQFDLKGQFLASITLAGLALAAIEAAESARIAVAALLAALGALLLFVRSQKRLGAMALVPPDIVESRGFRAAIVATTAMTFGMYGVLFLLPLTWQAIGMLNETQAGLALVPMAVVFVLVSPFSGVATERLGVRAVTSGGVAIIGFGLAVIAVGAPWSSILAAEIGLVLAGLGMGLATGPLMGAAVGAVAAARSGTASALVNVARMTGATIGVALLGTLFSASGGGATGLRFALSAGGALQIACAAIAWRMSASTDARRD